MANFVGCKFLEVLMKSPTGTLEYFGPGIEAGAAYSLPPHTHTCTCSSTWSLGSRQDTCNKTTAADSYDKVWQGTLWICQDAAASYGNSHEKPLSTLAFLIRTALEALPRHLLKTHMPSIHRLPWAQLVRIVRKGPLAPFL